MQGHCLETKNVGCDSTVGDCSLGSVEGAGVMLETKLISYQDVHDPEWINSTLSDQRHRGLVRYREQGEVMCCYQEK